MNDLQVRLTQERHHREDLEVKVLALEKEHQQMEAESQSLTEQLSRSANQQKGIATGLALLMFRVVKHLLMVCSPRDGARPFPRVHGPAPQGEGRCGGKSRESHRRS